LRNALADGRTGGFTTGPDGAVMNIVDAAEAYRGADIPTVVFAGREYGTGSARDWAAKGTLLLGVKAVIAESFERIHRANLVGVGVVPCQLPPGVSVTSLGIAGDTTVAIEGLSGLNGPSGTVRLVLTQSDGTVSTVPLTCRIDTEAELAQVREGGLFASAESAARSGA
jgi:aconitate hydratase